MKSLEEYVLVHGRHFTTDLAIAAIKSRWSPEEIERTSSTMVYYNVSGATFGDLVFLTNKHYINVYPCHTSKIKCIQHALDIIGDVDAVEYAFNLWLLKDSDLDLKDYI